MASDIDRLNDACFDGELTTATQLIIQGTPINSPNSKGYLPLYSAAETGNTEIMELLLQKYGAYVDVTGPSGATALYVAAQNGHSGSVEMLLGHKASVNKAISTDGATPLFIACQKGHTQIAELLLKYAASVHQVRLSDGHNPLYVSARYGHLSVVSVLLDNQAPVDMAATDGSTSLSIAAQFGHLDIVQMLIHHGASLNLCNDNGYSPLHCAVVGDQESTTELLCGAGTCVNTQTRKDDKYFNSGTYKYLKSGSTALHIAVHNRNQAIVKILLVNEADILEDNNGDSPLDLAKNQNFIDIQKQLEQYIPSKNENASQPQEEKKTQDKTTSGPSQAANTLNTTVEHSRQQTTSSGRKEGKVSFIGAEKHLYQGVSDNLLNRKQLTKIMTELAPCVCRIQTPTKFGTGFIIGSLTDLSNPAIQHCFILTCFHLGIKDDLARGCEAQFGYYESATIPMAKVRIMPDVFAYDQTLDYILLALERSPLFNDYVNSYLKLNLGALIHPVQPSPKDPLIILGHTGGREFTMDPAAYSVPRPICNVPQEFTFYQCRSVEGSSGGPCFSKDGGVLYAMHASGLWNGPRSQADPSTSVEQGVFLWHVLSHIKTKFVCDQQQDRPHITNEGFYQLFPQFPR